MPAAEMERCLLKERFLLLSYASYWLGYFQNSASTSKDEVEGKRIPRGDEKLRLGTGGKV
jgi:hypothetical protein